MTTQQTVSFFLETVIDDKTRKVTLRVSVRWSDINEPPIITQETIIDLLKQRGFSEFYRFDENISAIILDLATRLESLQSGSDEFQDVFETSVIAEAKDAVAEIKIADDASEAYLILTPAKGGKQYDLDGIKAFLIDGEVTDGVEDQRLFDLLQAVRQSETGDKIEKLVAVAQPPVDGEDTKFIPLVDTANERILKPQLREDGTINMRELGNLPIVTEGDKIMQKQLFTLGEVGIDVRGNWIEAEPGKDFEFDMSPGSVINPEEPLELLAEITGQPNLVRNGMKVENVVKVAAVDLSTGNIDIDANLLVEGDIVECMKVKCTGDITVGGVIESADVETEGSILVGKGIVGQIPKQVGEDIEISAHVRAEKMINAVFSSYSRLEAGEEIHMDEQLLHCDSTSKGCVTIGNKKSVGSQIIGGTTRASSTIESDVVGSQVGIRTYFDLSGPFKEKQQELAVFEKAAEEKNIQLNGLRDSYSQFTTLKMTPERKEQANKIKNTILHLNTVISELEKKGQVVRDERDEIISKLQLHVKRRLHSLVEVKIGARKFLSRRSMESGVISLLEGEVCFQPENLDKPE